MNTPTSACPVQGRDISLCAHFLALLPRIRTHAQIAFRHIVCPDRRADQIAETIALAWQWYRRLAERGRDAGHFPMVFAALVARAVRSGRRVAGMERSQDVLSPRAQRRHGFAVSRLPDGSALSASPLSEALRDNTVTPPDEQVVFRIDFPAWLASLSPRDGQLALDAALGHRTGELARKYRVCAGRVSQLRRAFYRDWCQFCGDSTSDA